jgi:hypothetical protein
MQAIAVDPGNPVALKNLGTILGQEGDSLRALYYLRRSNECDPLDLQDCVRPRLRRLTGDIGPAQKHFQKVLEMEAPEELRALARDGLREMAARELKARGPRKDGGLLSGWAWRLFRGRPQEEVREIAFEIGKLGQYGLDINDSQETHVLRALQGGPSRRWSCCASCALASRGSGLGWISEWTWEKSGSWRRS